MFRKQNNKGAVAVEEIQGFLFFLVFAIFFFLVFSLVRCSTENTYYDQGAPKVDINQLNLNDDLLFFLNRKLSSDSEKKVADLIIESVLEENYGDLKLQVRDYFNDKYEISKTKWELTVYTPQGRAVFHYPDYQWNYLDRSSTAVTSNRDPNVYDTTESKYQKQILTQTIIPIHYDSKINYLTVELTVTKYN